MRHGRRMVVTATTVVGLAAVALGQAGGLNGPVLKFCKDHLGKTVGNGECPALVSEAFKSAGAKPTYLFKETPNPMHGPRLSANSP